MMRAWDPLWKQSSTRRGWSLFECCMCLIAGSWTAVAWSTVVAVYIWRSAGAHRTCMSNTGLPISNLLLRNAHIVERGFKKCWCSFVGYCPSTTSFSVRPHCKNARRDRCQEYHNCFPFGELEETTRTSSNYMNEDYPARPEIKQSLPGWGDNCGADSSTLETDVCTPTCACHTRRRRRRCSFAAA